MDIRKITLKIIQLPATFRRVGDRSIISLLQEIRYFEIHTDIDELKILEVIKEHPEYVKDWVEWSEGNRASEGPYLRQNDDGRGLVGYYPGNDFKVYSDMYIACAAFIKLEIEGI
jgi:hypothetical protein